MKKILIAGFIITIMLVGCTTQKPFNQLYGTYGSDEGFKIVFTGSKMLVVQNNVIKHDYKYSVKNGEYIVNTANEANIFIDNISSDLKSFSTPIEAFNSKMRFFSYINDSTQP